MDNSNSFQVSNAHANDTDYQIAKLKAEAFDYKLKSRDYD